MTYQLLIGDCMETLKTLPDCSVQCVVTSPPYYGLRDYGTAKWSGGDEKCKHNPQKPDGGDRSDRTLPLGRGGIYKDMCKCGAIRVDSQIGLEQSPEEYIVKLVEVFREVRRVLKDDGTLWLNLGDSYNSSPSNQQSDGVGARGSKAQERQKREVDGLKPKDLMMIPARAALALQSDGWWLRQDIIWAKTNPMPESVTDRCTKSHEYIFLLTKSAKYFFDAEAIKEPSVSYRTNKPKEKSNTKNIVGNMSQRGVTRTTEGLDLKSQSEKTHLTRNKRDVWVVSTKPFKGAHFAVFPPELITPCILAGTSEKGECPKCGKAWIRVVKRKRMTRPELPKDDPRYRPNTYNGAYEDINGKKDAGYTETTTTGWQPQCKCNLVPIPQIILDPFSGSGTTLMVSMKHGRNAIGCELNPEYGEMTHRRMEKNK